MPLGRETAIAHKAGLAASVVQSILSRFGLGRLDWATGPRRPVGCCGATRPAGGGGVAVWPIQVPVITVVSEVAASDLRATSSPWPEWPGASPWRVSRCGPSCGGAGIGIALRPGQPIGWSSCRIALPVGGTSRRCRNAFQ